MAGVLTAAKLGVGLGAAFLFQRRNLGSWNLVFCIDLSWNEPFPWQPEILKLVCL